MTTKEDNQRELLSNLLQAVNENNKFSISLLLTRLKNTGYNIEKLIRSEESEGNSKNVH